jgi:hypothetical protein
MRVSDRRPVDHADVRCSHVQARRQRQGSAENVAHEDAHDPAVRDERDRATGVSASPVLHSRVNAAEEILQGLTARGAARGRSGEPSCPGPRPAGFELERRRAGPLSPLELAQRRVVDARESSPSAQARRHVLGAFETRGDDGREIDRAQLLGHPGSVPSAKLGERHVQGAIDPSSPGRIHLSVAEQEDPGGGRRHVRAV